MKPEHSLLDVGYSALRGGVYFINYLNNSNYYGIDINQSLIEAGKKELEKADLLNKHPNFLVNEDFQFNLFNQKFDFAITQSVFTHLR
ncbi:MAG: methyltransferase domain-containing protein [Bacillota bacterium]